MLLAILLAVLSVVEAVTIYTTLSVDAQGNKIMPTGIPTAAAAAITALNGESILCICRLATQLKSLELKKRIIQ